MKHGFVHFYSCLSVCRFPREPACKPNMMSQRANIISYVFCFVACLFECLLVWLVGRLAVYLIACMSLFCSMQDFEHQCTIPLSYGQRNVCPMTGSYDCGSGGPAIDHNMFCVSTYEIRFLTTFVDARLHERLNHAHYRHYKM